MNSIIAKTIKIINLVLKPAGARIVSRKAESFNMNAAIQRVHDHGIQIDHFIDIGGSNGIWSINAIKLFLSAGTFSGHSRPVISKMFCLVDLSETTSPKSTTSAASTMTRIQKSLFISPLARGRH
jgi:hypothetical protein